LITDQKSNVAAITQRERTPGIVSGGITRDLIMDFVPTDADVIVGDVVLTSGMGGVYPKGLIIGEVLSVSEEVNTLYKTITVRTLNDPNRLEEVAILLGAPPSIDNLPPAELEIPTAGAGS
jgi:rod shape-determining protein MreC